MLLETDFSLDCKGLSSVPGLTALDFGQDSRSVGTGYTKTPNLISRSRKGVVGTTNVFVDKTKQTGFWEGLVFFLVANIQPIFNIQKLQLHLVIVHLLLWGFFILPAWTLFISVSALNEFYFTSQQMCLFDEKKINHKGEVWCFQRYRWENLS